MKRYWPERNLVSGNLLKTHNRNGLNHNSGPLHGTSVNLFEF